jgi:3-methyladenine DNA glycosylase Mpg
MVCSGRSLCDRRDIYLCDAPLPEQILVGPRIGIGYATAEHQRAPWRYAVANSAWVSHRKGLRAPIDQRQSPSASADANRSSRSRGRAAAV